MDLTLQKLDSRNNTFLTADGLPLYHITTPLKFRGSTTIQKFDGPSSVQMGTVELHTFGRNVVVVWGRDMVPHKSSNVLSHSEIFDATDCRSYKWKSDTLDSGIFTLVENDGSEGLTAHFDPGCLGIIAKPRPPTLSVTPAGLPILDEIVATLIYMRQKRKRRRDPNHK